MPTNIDILLATYNGAAYLPEQLDSLFAQSCQDFRVIARDDGSTDGTVEVLNRYAGFHPDRFVVANNDGRRLGASGSFGALLALSAAGYVMFCDQDDVWLPDKVAVSLAAMRDLERVHGMASPLLVSTDLKVVDDRLAEIAESFWRFSRIHPERLTCLPRVLMQNFATGCTVMVNRPLLDLALPVPAESVMHDWWLALVATVFGKTLPIRRATVLYRQHQRNDIGATRWSFWEGVARFFFDRRRRRAAIAQQEEIYLALERQAQALAARFGERLPEADREILRVFGTLHAHGFLGRRRLLLKHGFLLSDRWQSFMMLVR